MASPNKKLKICVLQSSYEESNSPFKEHDIYSEVACHLPHHQVDQFLVVKRTAVEFVSNLAQKGGYDVFINLCDGSEGEDRAGIEVVHTLEKEGVAFTGADSLFFEPTKEFMKKAALANGIKTPAWVFAYKEEDISEAEKLKFPLIVKHFNSFGSIGTSKDSKVNNAEQLTKQARQMIKEFGGALIEEFISGKEFTVLVAENPNDANEPLAFVPVECSFPEGEDFKHFNLKFVDYAQMKWVPCKDQKTIEKLKDVTKKIFVATKGVSYGRADIRMDDATGEPYFLEINPNCGIFCPPGGDGAAADFILLNDPIKHTGFIELIMEAAINRADRLKKISEKVKSSS